MNKLKSLLAYTSKTRKTGPRSGADRRFRLLFMRGAPAYFALAAFFFGRYATTANTTSTAAEMI